MKTSADNRFDELFRERFKDFKENPPESVLEKLKNTVSGISNPTPFWKKGGFFATAVIVVLVSSTILLINSFSTSNNVEKTVKNNLVANNISVSSSNNQVASINKIENISNNEKNTNNPVKNQELISTNQVSANNSVNIEKTKIDNEKPVNQNNLIEKNVSPESLTDVKIIVNVKAATCHNNNGLVTLSSNNKNTLFYWTEIDLENPHSSMDKLRAGTYNIKSTANNGFVKTFTVTVPDSGITRAQFTHYEMTQNIGVPVYFTNNTTIDGIAANDVENTTFKWYFGDGEILSEYNPEHTYISTGQYTISLVATSPQGCKDSIMLPLNITGSDIQMPNVFTPNGDGNNDVFKPVTQGLNSFNCTIVNQNGQIIYNWTDPTQGWDGKINHGLQMASPGTYFYIVKGVGVDGKIIEQKGVFDLRL